MPANRALETFELHPDFKMELVAAEPLVSDPIDMEIDEHGRLYVLEMHGYPTDQSGSDRIVQLRDVDGDGRMDESTVFADSLVWPMGIMRWKNGLIVTEAPDVVYLEDTDGDGRADLRQTLLTGFFDQDPESDVNNPIYGLDNWIYLANTRRSDSDIRFVDREDGPRIPEEQTARNVRFHPDRGTLEAQSSRTQYGHTFDRWGRQLLVSNRNHVFQEVIAARYLERRPDLLVSNATASISDHGAAAQVFPITDDPNPQILTDVGEITAACGITFYGGGAFPPEFEHASFVGEPAHNLVHVDRLSSDGPALTASRLEPHTEFLASTDAWFRPVNMYVGPDGALYVVDYYRQIIEGPEWLADDVLESGDLYNGSDQGRIYRISAREAGPADWTSGLDLADASDEELVGYLAHPNVWWRRHAQRLLMDHRADGIVPDLIALAESGVSAPGRLHALWTLEGMGELQEGLIEAALEDEEAGIRENAVQLAERRMTESPALQDRIIRMRNDPDPRVRFQVLLTLGFVDSPSAASAREELLFESVDDRWVQIAALSSPDADERELLSRLIRDYEANYASFIRELSAMVAANRPADDLRRLLRDAAVPAEAPGTATRYAAQTSDASWQAHVLEGIAQGLNSRSDGPAAVRGEATHIVTALFDHPADSVRQAALRVLDVVGLPDDRESAVRRAVEIVRDEERPAEHRAQAIHVIRLGDPAAHTDLLRDLIAPSEPTAVQLAAVQAFGAAPGTESSRHLLENWTVLTPEVRDEALATMLSRPLQTERIELILDALADGTVHPSGISWPHKVTLMRDIPDSLKRVARDLITSAEAERRHEVAEYATAVKQRNPNPDQGRALFEEQCALCHRLGDIAEGSDFGPDLMSVRGWKPENVVAHVVEPNQSITLGYDYWQIELENGESLQGIIAEESANAVTIRRLSQPDVTIPRRDIASLTNLNVSIMPSDFMERMSPQEMADLTAFIRTGR